MSSAIIYVDNNDLTGVPGVFGTDKNYISCNLTATQFLVKKLLGGVKLTPLPRDSSFTWSNFFPYHLDNMIFIDNFSSEQNFFLDDVGLNVTKLRKELWLALLFIMEFMCVYFYL